MNLLQISVIEPVIKTICAQLSYELNSQLLLTAAADFLAALVVRFPASTDLLELFIRNTTHHVKRIRFNVLRWFGRLQVTKESVEFLSSLQRAISQLFQSTDDDLWPPCVWETEDVSCVKPRWDYEEGEDVLWQDDRVLNAYLDVSNVLNQRFGIKPDRDDPMIIVGMKWHLPEIRLAAFHLWATCLEKALEDSENNSVLEQFIIHNSSRSISILPRPVNVASESCLMPSEGKIEWVKEVNNFRCKLEDDQRGMSYLPEDVRGTSLPLPSPELARRRLEECMQISGSCDSKSCPEFDVLYINLEKAGYDQRDVINLIKSHEDVETALNAISDTVAR
uniref:UBA domain-containing protein n=1 Tax=Angiostrongylus cantonensis TaxID=6313 RepID=A0A0K0D7L4_ANGCA